MVDVAFFSGQISFKVSFSTPPTDFDFTIYNPLTTRFGKLKLSINCLSVPLTSYERSAVIILVEANDFKKAI